VRDTQGSRPPGRVLVVDDDDGMRALLRRMLEDEGYQVMELDRGSRVMQVLRDVPFDLIILDKEMPGISGLELLPMLRNEFPEIPVVFVTAFGGHQIAARAIRLGATSYLEKPFRLARLRDAVHGLTGRGEHRTG
jgi:DNA-binding NtrC family response regulator